MIKPQMTFESLFDEHNAAVDRSLFKEKILQDFMTTGKVVQVDASENAGCDLAIKVLDSHSSMGYNVFKNHDEYQDWFKQSMHEPTEDEVMQSLRDNG